MMLLYLLIDSMLLRIRKLRFMQPNLRRRVGISSHLPCVANSTYGEPSNLTDGANYYLNNPKPVTMVNAAVGRVLSKASRRALASKKDFSTLYAATEEFPG